MSPLSAQLKPIFQSPLSSLMKLFTVGSPAVWRRSRDPRLRLDAPDLHFLARMTTVRTTPVPPDTGL